MVDPGAQIGYESSDWAFGGAREGPKALKEKKEKKREKTKGEKKKEKRKEKNKEKVKKRSWSILIGHGTASGISLIDCIKTVSLSY